MVVPLTALAILYGVVSACSDASMPDDSGLVNPQQPVTFTTYVGQQALTRANANLIADETALQRTGFGVYAAYTGYAQWGTGDGKATVEPNFMYNQRVESIITDISKPDVRSWVYAPVKYWPNENQPADNQEATGVTNPHSYVSFFAYAPYKTTAELTASASDASATGIVEQKPNDHDGDPQIRYRWTTDMDAVEDVLWAKQTDRYKYDDTSDANDNGRIGDAVNFEFAHALAAVDIKVQRVFDDIGNPDRIPDENKGTKIFISSFHLSSSEAFMSEGWLNLNTGQFTKEGDNTGKFLIHYGERTIDERAAKSPKDTIAINPNISGSRYPNEAVAEVNDVELKKYATEGTGVDERQQSLAKDGYLLILMPQTLTNVLPVITYSFVTQDNSLILNDLQDKDGNKYARIQNTITGVNNGGTTNYIESLTLAGGKKYTLLCRIHVESVTFQVKGVEFEVTDVEDWDFPMRFNPSVDDWKGTTPIPHTLDEPDE